jgi:hypothetical protein
VSRQAKAARLVIVPDEVSGPPGAAEAAEIRALYATAQAGIRAFVLMGFRLIEVKARLPHGGYMRWISENLSDLGRSHLHRSRQVAEGIALHLGWDGSNVPRVGHLPELPPEVLELIDGKSGRALLAELREPLDEKAAKTEEAHRLLCEEVWEHDGGKRDEWEPRVLSGEINYHRAYTGMLGETATAGKAKEEREVWAVFDSKLCAMKTPFRKLERLITEDPLRKRDLIIQIGGWARMDMSEEMRRVWLEALERSLGEKGGLDELVP